MTAQEFRALFEAVSNWGRWDDGGWRGALNPLTPARIEDAARLVRSGVTVTLSRALTTEARIEVPKPAEHHMTMLTDEDIGSGSVRFAKDYVGLDYHNEGHTHIDAFCHVAFEGTFFDGPEIGTCISAIPASPCSARSGCSSCPPSTRYSTGSPRPRAGAPG